MLISRNDILRIVWLKMIIWVTGVLRKAVVGDWCFNNLCGNHLQSQVKMWPSCKLRWFPLKQRWLYPASRVSFDLPRSVGKRKETLHRSACHSSKEMDESLQFWLVKPVFFICAHDPRSLLPLPDWSRKIEGDSARRVRWLLHSQVFKTSVTDVANNSPSQDCSH